MVDLADIFRQYGPAYRRQFEDQLSADQCYAMWSIEHCRTETLGGHVYHCPDCDQDVYQYHSCRNRHCPKCQNDNAQTWLEHQQAWLLPVPYFMLTFTLPAPLRTVARHRPALIYDLLFRTSAAATQHLAADRRFVGGQLGLVGVLHTWGRTLTYHPHVHYLLPAGGWTEEQLWQPAREDFLVPVKALSGIFRARCRDALRTTSFFADVSASAWEQDWVVHCKAVGNGATAFKYLAPYIFRVAISNNRILHVENDQVTFRYRASDTGQLKQCTLTAQEFIRRFLQHVLPKHFVKVRYYGFLSPGQRSRLAAIRQQLTAMASVNPSPRTPTADPPTAPTGKETSPSAPTESHPPRDGSTSRTVTSGTTLPVTSTPRPSPREVRCPACGRLLQCGTLRLPTRGPPHA